MTESLAIGWLLRRSTTEQEIFGNNMLILFSKDFWIFDIRMC